MSRLKSLPFAPSPVGTAVVAVLVALVGLIPQYLSRTIPDVAFPLWAAGRVLDGATLYVDILEINPPLFIWLDVPLVALARWAGMDPILVFRVAVTGLLVASVAGVVWVRGGSAARRPGSPTIETLAVVFALFVLPRLDWGEREHLALALMLPWIAVAVRRAEGREVSRRMALLTGVAAGVGIALKPHFVLVWVGREVAIRLGGSAARRLRHHSGLSDRRLDGQTDGYWWARADTWAPVVVCVAYLTAAVVFTPEYFPLVQELAGPYSRFIRATVVETMFGPAPAVALASLVIAVGLRRLRPAEPPNRRAALLVLWWTTAAWAVVALLQLKGFRYHWYPAMALGLLLLSQVSLEARGARVSFFRALNRSAATAVVVVSLVMNTWGCFEQLERRDSPEWDPTLGSLVGALRGKVGPGDTLAVLSPNMASGFPLTNYLGTVWPLRLPHAWPIIVTYRAALEQGVQPDLRADSMMLPLERWLLETMSEDLTSADPEWILVPRALPRERMPYMWRVPVVSYLKRNARIERALSAYDSLATVGLYSVWHRRSDDPVPEIVSSDWPLDDSQQKSKAVPISDGAVWPALFIICAVALDMIAALRETQGAWSK